MKTRQIIAMTALCLALAACAQSSCAACSDGSSDFTGYSSVLVSSDGARAWIPSAWGRSLNSCDADAVAGGVHFVDFTSRSSVAFDLPVLPGIDSLLAGNEVVSFEGRWNQGGMGPAYPESEGGAFTTVSLDGAAATLSPLADGGSLMATAAGRVAFFAPGNNRLTIHHAGEVDSSVGIPEPGGPIAGVDSSIYIGTGTGVARVDPIARVYRQTFSTCPASLLAPIGPTHLFVGCEGGGAGILALQNGSFAVLSTSGGFQAASGSNVFARAMVTTTAGSRVVLPTGFAGTSQGFVFSDVVFVSSSNAFALTGDHSLSLFRIPLDGSPVASVSVPNHFFYRLGGNSNALVGATVDRGEQYTTFTPQFVQLDPVDGHLLGTAPVTPPPGIFHWP